MNMTRRRQSFREAKQNDFHGMASKVSSTNLSLPSKQCPANPPRQLWNGTEMRSSNGNPTAPPRNSSTSELQRRNREASLNALDCSRLIDGHLLHSWMEIALKQGGLHDSN